MKLLAFDPSSTRTGWALMTDDKLDLWSAIPAPDRCPAAIVRTMADGARKVIAETKPDAIVVETPQTANFGGRGRRNTTSLPTYGMGVGAVLVAALDSGVPVWFVSATLWGQSIRSGGDGKPDRVAWVRTRWGVDLYKLIGKGAAPDIADAICLAEWACNRWDRREAV